MSNQSAHCVLQRDGVVHDSKSPNVTKPCGGMKLMIGGVFTQASVAGEQQHLFPLLQCLKDRTHPDMRNEQRALLESSAIFVMRH